MFSRTRDTRFVTQRQKWHNSTRTQPPTGLVRRVPPKTWIHSDRFAVPFVVHTKGMYRPEDFPFVMLFAPVRLLRNASASAWRPWIRLPDKHTSLGADNCRSSATTADRFTDTCCRRSLSDDDDDDDYTMTSGFRRPRFPGDRVFGGARFSSDRRAKNSKTRCGSSFGGDVIFEWVFFGGLQKNVRKFKKTHCTRHGGPVPETRCDGETGKLEKRVKKIPK